MIISYFAFIYIPFIINAEFHVDDYCNYLQSTPEPEVLVYNRIPKTGSSTIDALLQNSTDAEFFAVGRDYWGYNIDEKSKEINSIIKEQIRETSKKLTVAGHFSYPTNINNNTLGVKSIEYINSFRNCADRYISDIFQTLYTSKAADKRIMEHTQEAFVNNFFNNRSRDDCFGDLNCIKTSLHKFRSVPVIEQYICGKNRTSRCVSDKLFQPYGSNAFVGIALLEHLPASLHVLKCALPTYFSSPIGAMNSTHLKEGIGHSNYTTLLNFVQSKCDGDDAYYNIAKERLMAIYAHISKTKNHMKCCRKNATKKGH